jgi:hypothetical protein
MCAGTIGKDTSYKEAMKKDGLVSGHCYALISAYSENIKGKMLN